MRSEFCPCFDLGNIHIKESKKKKRFYFFTRIENQICLISWTSLIRSGKYPSNRPGVQLLQHVQKTNLMFNKHVTDQTLSVAQDLYEILIVKFQGLVTWSSHILYGFQVCCCFKYLKTVENERNLAFKSKYRSRTFFFQF